MINKLFRSRAGKQIKTPQRTYAVARAELLPVTDDVLKSAKAAFAATVDTEDTSFSSLEKQEDLLYFKAVYATCGFNLNDDVFINEEFWSARNTPILKPSNWQHKDSDILGVIYAVEAQYLDGTSIDIENDKIPEDDFELIVHGVVYKYTFPDFAQEIEKRSEAGELYVSMETWFNDFSYALLDEDNSTIDVVDRNSKTVALDKYLRCNGGSGQYDKQRIGRVLKGLTFGGMGFVDQPANPRSSGLVYASKKNKVVIQEIEMHETNDVGKVVAAELDARERAKRLQSLEKDNERLASEKAEAAQNAERAAEQKQAAEDAKAISEAVLAKVEKLLDSAIAGVGDNAPAEIAKIDNADSAEEKFAAKISWLAETAKASSEDTDLEAVKAERDELKAKVEKFEAEKAEAEKAARTEARKSDVVELLGEDTNEEDVDKIVAGLVDLDDEAYTERLDTLKLVAAKSRPELDEKGGSGSADEEGKSGESKAKSGPREDHKVNVAASLDKAIVEEAVEPNGQDTEDDTNFGFAGILGSDDTDSNKE